jgi:hypothetical protein
MAKAQVSKGGVNLKRSSTLVLDHRTNPQMVTTTSPSTLNSPKLSQGQNPRIPSSRSDNSLSPVSTTLPASTATEFANLRSLLTTPLQQLIPADRP